MQTLHRVRDRLVGDRTSLMNQIRSLLLERGHIVAQGRARLAVALTELLDGEERVLAARIHELIGDMRRQWVALDERIKAFDAEFAAAAKAQDGAKRLLSIPGIGALNATALVAAMGDAGTFARGRDLAAWLGLVPRQVTTGGRPKLLGITKRGSKYLRKMLIQGARSALPTLKAGDTPVGVWLRGLLARAHLNTAVVALAAKMARTVLGAAAARRCLQGRARGTSGGLKPDRLTRTGVGLRCLWVATRRWPDCQPVSWNPPAKDGTRCRPLMRTRTRGSPSWPTARRKAGYVCADRSSWTRETTCRRGGPYVLDAPAAFACALIEVPSRNTMPRSAPPAFARSNRRSQTPRRDHRMKICAAFHHGPNSVGIERHFAPFRHRQTIASTVRRRFDGGTLACGRQASTRGSSTDHSASVKTILASASAETTWSPDQTLTGPSDDRRKPVSGRSDPGAGGLADLAAQGAVRDPAPRDRTWFSERKSPNWRHTPPRRSGPVHCRDSRAHRTV